MTIELPRAGGTRTGALARSWGLSSLAGAVLAVFSFFAIQGCGDRDGPRGLTKQAIAFGDVPDGLRTAAQKELPDVKLNEAWKNLDGTGKLHSYEIRGKRAADGKIREIRIATDGQVLEKE
jgi:hypothetical protein